MAGPAHTFRAHDQADRYARGWCPDGYRHEADCSARRAPGVIRRWLRDAGSFSMVPRAGKLWRHGLRANPDQVPVPVGSETLLFLAKYWRGRTRNDELRKQTKEWHGPGKSRDLERRKC